MKLLGTITIYLLLNNLGKRTKYQVIGPQATTAMNDIVDALAIKDPSRTKAIPSTTRHH